MYAANNAEDDDDDDVFHFNNYYDGTRHQANLELELETLFDHALQISAAVAATTVNQTFISTFEIPTKKEEYAYFTMDDVKNILFVSIKVIPNHDYNDDDDVVTLKVKAPLPTHYIQYINTKTLM